MTPRTRIQNLYIRMYVCMGVCMYKISFAFDTGRSFDSIFVKLGRTVVSVENWSCIVFEPIRPNEEGLRKFENFLENENLTTDFSEIQ